MTRNRILPVVAVLALLFQTGCYTNLRVSFGNGTGQKIGVKDTQTGQEVQIAPGKFRKVSHDQADLIVTTPDKTRYQFAGVKVVDSAMDQKYYGHNSGLFGTWHIDLNILLQTNMNLYVLLPGKKTVDASIPQPEGYPKSGKKMTE
jgi:hypothetical protein